MAQIETLGILQEIEALVSDKLQVVSYKWLSRNFLVSSNAAKRLLQEFVEKHTSGLEVVYTLSGWLQNNPPSYHIRLVSGPKLEDAKQEYDGNCSLHVYSVQAAIPNDPAALWNDEFVQAEELFKQPSAVDNCLRDNRFCGILNPFVKRNVDGTPINNTTLQPKSVRILGPSKSNSAHENIIVPPPQQVKVDQSGPKVGQQSTNLVKDIKTESHGTGVHYQASKPSLDREKVPPLPTNEKKGQNDKSSIGNGGSLASLWGRASAKSKVTLAPAVNNSLISDPAASAEAQICACEAIEDQSSDDEAQNVNFKRASNGEGGRKRRVVLDYSDDEYEDAVSLASPDLPKGTIVKTLPVKPVVNDQTEGKLKVKEEKSTDRASDQVVRKNSSVARKSMNSKDSSKENIQNCIDGDDVKADIVANAAPNSPKRRKVLKTCIDERGREVTEVVWEGEETETKKADNSAMKKAETNAITDSVDRAAAVKKSALGKTAPSKPGGKTGNKMGGSKDAKQGSLLSFFNRV
ncbi:hypothetical protein P3X46_006933 [Hevea brasiliensis]|uniref:DNA polymerase delta subunit 3 n=1 Tax=Hevea brasiliensis TaxID=3981 RepID=A0ABQ9MUB2_HEVBR|nr:uncharacterized protein LOC110650011 [Hevea brasiliensis]KAJ9183012.1 hypothetical protein P3X46_006933 [Hevea brasiliensis]